MAKAKRAAKRKTQAVPVPMPLPPEPSTSPSSKGTGLWVRLGVVAAVAVLLWWNMTPPEKRKKIFPKPSATGGGPGAPDMKGAPNTMQEWVHEFNGVKTLRGATGWGGIPKKDEAIMGGPLTMNKIVYKSGIGTHAPSEIVFDLKGKYSRFSCRAGMDDKGQDPGAFTLIVKAGDRKLFQSKVVKVGSLPVPINVDVTGVKELSLVVDPMGDANWDQADWVDLKFTPAAAAQP